jgi:aspartate/methionine/tyrosine aminotransferase
MTSNLKTYDLGFGDPVCVRDALTEQYSIPLDLIKLKDITYPDPVGDEELIKRLVSKSPLTGNDNVVLTVGATQALNAILRVLKKEGKSAVSKGDPCFMYYNDIITRAGFEIKDGFNFPDGDIILYDWPSNPYGFADEMFTHFEKDFIWDAVYFSPTYINISGPEPVGWRFKIGGFSKLLGLSGLRVGWIVCRDKSDLDKIIHEIRYENCGISSVSMTIALDVMKKLDFQTFFKSSRARVNYNREDVRKIIKIFDGQEVPTNGMFYPVKANDKSLSILKKADVKFITLKEGKEPLIRLSLGQNNTITRDAVKAVLTADRIRRKK